MKKYQVLALIGIISACSFAEAKSRTPASRPDPKAIANEAADGFCRNFMKTWSGHESIPVKAEGAIAAPNQTTVYTVSCHNADPSPDHLFNAEIHVKFSALGALDSVSLVSVAE